MTFDAVRNIRMWPLVLRVVRTYAPMITLPFAAVIGVIGYAVENILSGRVRIFVFFSHMKHINIYKE